MLIASKFSLSNAYDQKSEIIRVCRSVDEFSYFFTICFADILAFVRFTLQYTLDIYPILCHQGLSVDTPYFTYLRLIQNILWEACISLRGQPLGLYRIFKLRWSYLLLKLLIFDLRMLKMQILLISQWIYLFLTLDLRLHRTMKKQWRCLLRSFNSLILQWIYMRYHTKLFKKVRLCAMILNFWCSASSHSDWIFRCF